LEETKKSRGKEKKKTRFGQQLIEALSSKDTPTGRKRKEKKGLALGLNLNAEKRQRNREKKNAARDGSESGLSSYWIRRREGISKHKGKKGIN